MEQTPESKPLPDMTKERWSVRRLALEQISAEFMMLDA